MTPVELVLSRLPDAKRNGRGWQARCPAHNDRRPSLAVDVGDDGRALIRCHAGCTAEAIVAAVGLTLRDLMPVDALTVDGTRPATHPKGVPSTPATSARPGRQRVYPKAHDAVAELERRHGPRSATWTYHNAGGEPVGVVVRWDRLGGKDIRPVSRTPAGWVIGGMPKPRPLYNLPTLAGAPRIYITEGEKAAEAVISLGLVATTSPHGAQAASSADWSPLAGKFCLILPDADEAGEQYADDVLRVLARLLPPPTVKVVVLPGLPEHGDGVEYVAGRRAAGLDDAAIRAAIEALADTAEPVELAPIDSSAGTYHAFPTEVLPEPIRSFVSKGAQAIGCDPSYIALPMLSVLAAAIGNTRRIQLRRGWTEPAIVWTAIVGDSGTLKTPAFKLVMQPIRDMQARKFKGHQAACEQYERDLLRYDAELTTWKRQAGNGDGTAGDPPEKPQPPQAERYVVSDTTVEALAPILLANPRGVLLARDELAGWIGSFDRYVGGKGGADAAHWLSMHNGESIVVDRKTGTLRTIYVPSAAVSITGSVQPGILDRVMGYEHRESGLLARLLLAMPPRRVKHWTEATIPEAVEASVAEIIRALYDLQPDYDDSGDLRPRILRLTAGGKAAWATFYNAHAQEHADLTGDLSAAWSKLEGYAARLALIVHCVRLAAGDPTLSGPEAVDETSVAAGVTLSQWFGSGARRVYGILGESDDDRERRQLVELILRKGGVVTPRELMRGSRMFATTADAEGALTELVNAGRGRWEVAPPGPRGGQPSKRFVLAGSTPARPPADTADVDNTPAHDPASGGSVNVNTVNAPDDDGAGCPDGEQPPDDAPFGNVPDPDPADGDDWGEV